MLINRDFEISSCDDYELKIRRDSLLKFRVTHDDTRQIKALLFITPGLGGDADSNYKDNLAGFVASNYDVGVVSVNYHCIGNRPQVGAGIAFDEFDCKILKQRCDEAGIWLDERIFSALNDPVNAKNLLFYLDEELSVKKRQNALNDDFLLRISMSVYPTNGEYQNFGVMQGLDLLNALLFIRKNVNFSQNGGGCGEIPAVLLGSSHGAYVSYMAAKMAPWLVSGVIDNSAYVVLPWQSIGFGKEIDYIKYPCAALKGNFNHIMGYFFDKTHWTLNPKSPYYFSESAEKIRDIYEPEHLKEMAKYNKPIFVSYHCNNDFIAPFEHKVALFDELKNLGYDATLYAITDENQVDGKFIKKLEHGMDMSLKTLIKRELNKMLDKISQNTQNKGQISYKSAGKIYKFYEQNDKILLDLI